MQRFEEIIQAKPGTAESDEADVLSLLIKDYEDKHYVIAAPSPLEEIKYRMEQQGISNRDLASILGFESRVTDIFNKHRKLNLTMIRQLHITIEYTSSNVSQRVLGFCKLTRCCTILFRSC